MEHEKIKICYIIPDLGFGGAQRQLLLLLEHLDRKLFSHSVINLNASPDIAEFHNVGTRVIRMHYTGQRDLKKIFSLARILSVEKPHFTHTILTSANFYGLIAAVVSGAPYKILSERSLGNNFTGLRKFAYPQIYRLADVIVTNSTANSQHIAKISNGSCHKIRIIPNGFNLPSRSNSANLHSTKIKYGIKSDDFVVGTVTHLTPEKDVMCLLRAIRECRKKFRNVKCIVIGPGPLRDEIQRAVKELELVDHVVLAGYLHHSEVLPTLNLFDCFVLPSRVEGMPNALMEAMSFGLPCVASRVGGVPELITDSKTGFLFESGDYRELACKIQTVRQNRDLARLLGTRAQRKVQEEFSVEKMVRAYENLYNGMVYNASQSDRPLPSNRGV